MSQFFESGGQSIGASALASVLPMNIQDWFPLGWTGWIFLLLKELSRVFSNIIVQKHQFFGAQLSSQSNSHIHILLLEKPKLWLDGPCWQSNVSAFQYAVYVGHNFPYKEQASFNFMAAVTICSDSGAPQNKIWQCFHCFPIYFSRSDGTRCHGRSQKKTL